MKMALGERSDFNSFACVTLPWYNLLTPQDITSNSRYCLLYNPYDVSLEKLELNQPMIP